MTLARPLNLFALSDCKSMARVPLCPDPPPSAGARRCRSGRCTESAPTCSAATAFRNPWNPQGSARWGAAAWSHVCSRLGGTKGNSVDESRSRRWTLECIRRAESPNIFVSAETVLLRKQSFALLAFPLVDGDPGSLAQACILQPQDCRRGG